ncbi:hypothetical protein ACFQ1R_11740 [Mariniflexile jejuense]|uniref:Uncharacterized protein n=1 Tax=Mariniflexile jejuense TaxID=1173582 RepID=A0ABW3JJW5_9FLAO
MDILDSFLEFFKDKNKPLLLYALLCFFGGLICLLLSKYSNLQVSGVSAWAKPFNFFISISIFAFSMALYLDYLDNQKQVTIYCWSFMIFLSIELLMIAVQAARGRKSHYNIDTPLDRVIFALMGLSITVILIHTIYITFLFFIQKQFSVSDEMILAIKLSLIIMVIFMLEGYVMISLSKHTIGSEDVTKGIPAFNWSKNYGDLRVAHFFGMHALQIIPILTFVLASTKRDVYLIAFLYFVFVTFTLIQAWQGRPFIK